jgi:glycosyltransferase involved in cell wall biosynthesis
VLSNDGPNIGSMISEARVNVSVIIPAFNEEDSIEKNLFEIESYMNSYAGNGTWELIVVNDGSKDNTLKIVKRLAQEKPWLKVADLVLNYGRGKALRAGFERASGDRIVTLDADLSYAPYHIERMLSKLEEENADIVVASAYGKNGTVQNVPWKRLWLSRIGNQILSYMFNGGITVLTCVTRAYKGEFIKQLDLHSDDKEIHLEILAKAKVLRAKIMEVPADLNWRQEKRLKPDSRKQPIRRSTLRARKTSSSHLFFALLNKPGMIFWIPGFLLLGISAVIFLIILSTILSDPMISISVYHTLRNSMISASVSWLVMAFSFLLGVQFFTLGFMTNQSKAHQEENYRTLNAIYRALKDKRG